MEERIKREIEEEERGPAVAGNVRDDLKVAQWTIHIPDWREACDVTYTHKNTPTRDPFRPYLVSQVGQTSLSWAG